MEEIIFLIVKVEINYDKKVNRKDAIKKAKNCVVGQRILGSTGCNPKSAKIYKKQVKFSLN